MLKIRINCQKRKKKQAKKYSRVDFFLPFSPLVFGSRPLKASKVKNMFVLIFYKIFRKFDLKVMKLRNHKKISKENFSKTKTFQQCF